MIRTFIQITSLVLTLEAAIFLAKGNLGLSPQAIAEISSTKWDYNSDLISSLAQQRADTWVGVVLLLGAFFLQMANALWPMRYVDFDVHKGAAAYAVVFSVVLGFGALFLAKEVAQSTASDVKKILDRPAPPPEPAPTKAQ
jgi:hypothetical protein